MTTTPATPATPTTVVTPTADSDVVLCPGGPMLLRGRHLVEDADGVRHETTRPVTAVCRCGKSQLAPWCDGTHKVLPDKLRPA